MRFFGKKEDTPPSKENVERPAALPKTDPRNDPNLIRVFDKFGRELLITKDEWRRSVLPGTLKSNWNNPDQLYAVIVGALNDGFLPDVLEASRHLHEIDAHSSRATCVLAIVLMKSGQLDQAEHVLTSYLQKSGEDGSVLTNLAKVYASRKETQKADATLWRALEIDPNQDNALAWFGAVERERNGEQAWPGAMRRVAALPGSWRAHLWLAREALTIKDIDSAKSSYHEALSRVGENVPADFLMQMSGDLGRAGYLREALDLTEPQFRADTHGLNVGNNLIKAHLDLNDLASAKNLLDQLYSLKRPDWRSTLSFWDTEIAKKRVAQNQPKRGAPFAVSILCSEGPVWLGPESHAVHLGPRKATNAPLVSFLGATAEIVHTSDEVQLQLANDPGRMSRSLPLYLLEQVVFRSTCRVQSLVPCVVGPPAGFVLGGVRWSDEEAARYSVQTPLRSDYVVICHLLTLGDPWTAELRLIDSISSQCLETLTAPFAIKSPEGPFVEVANKLIEVLEARSTASRESGSNIYSVPTGPQFGDYLLRLEQLLALGCSTSLEGFTLNGEREILDGNLQLNVACPKNVPTRLILAQVLLSMSKIRPTIVGEFKEKVRLLQREYPLSPDVQGPIDLILAEAFKES